MRLLFALFFTAIIFSVCSRKKSTKNEASPIGTVSFTGISNHATVSGTVTAQLTVAGGSSIKKYEVYVNDSLLTTGTTSSYSFSWNTLKYVNGTYVLKGVAYDGNGNKTEVSISVTIKNILITLNIKPSIYIGYTTNYVVSDSLGNILQTVKYNGTDTVLELSADRPYLGQRFNVFEVRAGVNTYIAGYFNIERNGAWNLKPIVPKLSSVYSTNNITFSKVPQFSRITASSDVFGLTFNNLTDLSNVTNYGFSPTGKEFVQWVDNNNNGFNNFFNIDPANKNINIDLSLPAQPSIKTTVNLPPGGINGYGTLYGRTDINYDLYYLVDQAYSSGASFDYFRPAGTYLKNYGCIVSYQKNGWLFTNVIADIIPQTIPPFNVGATILNSSLPAFNFTSQGDFDYYNLNFSNAANKTYISLYSTPGYHSFKFPDILKLGQAPNLTVNDFKLFSIGLYSTLGFKNNQLYYQTLLSFPPLPLPGLSAYKSFP
jgi:hypothetical protein